MQTVTRILEFDAAHRVPGHEGKCKHLHGHRYKVELTCRPKNGLDALGRVIDFSVMKSVVGEWIDSNLDHNTILWTGDPLVAAIESATRDHPRDVYVMSSIPTAENLAELVAVHASELLRDHAIVVVDVVVWETPNCKAQYRMSQ